MEPTEGSPEPAPEPTVLDWVKSLFRLRPMRIPRGEAPVAGPGVLADEFPGDPEGAGEPDRRGPGVDHGLRFRSQSADGVQPEECVLDVGPRLRPGQWRAVVDLDRSAVDRQGGHFAAAAKDHEPALNERQEELGLQASEDRTQKP